MEPSLSPPQKTLRTTNTGFALMVLAVFVGVLYGVIQSEQEPRYGQLGIDCVATKSERASNFLIYEGARRLQVLVYRK
ncbi:MAG: hypothetical protein U0103_03180 [Candidatus Obscuribacterales bacterium]